MSTHDDAEKRAALDAAFTTPLADTSRLEAAVGTDEFMDAFAATLSEIAATGRRLVDAFGGDRRAAVAAMLADPRMPTVEAARDHLDQVRAMMASSTSTKH